MRLLGCANCKLGRLKQSCPLGAVLILLVSLCSGCANLKMSWPASSAARPGSTSGASTARSTAPVDVGSSGQSASTDRPARLANKRAVASDIVRPARSATAGKEDGKTDSEITQAGRQVRLNTDLPPAGVMADLTGLSKDIHPADSVIPAPNSEYPIDLSTALELAVGQNPEIALARAGILEALALQKQARVLLLPSLNAGGNYDGHAGNIQRSAGTMLRISRQAVYLGGGAGVEAAFTVGIPAVLINSATTEALYEPLAAQQRLNGSRFEARAVNNDILLEVVMRHLDLLGAQAALEAYRLSEMQVQEVVNITRDFAAAGEGRPANARRAEAEWKLFLREVQKTEEEVAVSSARLARHLNLDPSVRLRPLTGGPMAPIDLIDYNQPAEELLAEALQRRPEMGSTAARIAELEFKYKEERARPLLPNLWLGFSGGVFGGGSNLRPPDIAHFGGRTDFDIVIYWTLQNLGLGNLNLQRRRLAQVGEASAARSIMVNRIRREIASAQADAKATRRQIDVARVELQVSENGFKQDLAAVRQNLALPIEVLNSQNLLARARINLIKAIVAYNQAQFRLFVAMGSPPPLVGPEAKPNNPPPIATPIHSPIVPLH